MRLSEREKYTPSPAMNGRATATTPSDFVHSTLPSAARITRTSPAVAATTTHPLSSRGGAAKPPVMGTLHFAAPVAVSKAESSSSPATTSSPSPTAGGCVATISCCQRILPASRSMATSDPLRSGT